MINNKIEEDIHNIYYCLDMHFLNELNKGMILILNTLV